MGVIGVRVCGCHCRVRVCGRHQSEGVWTSLQGEVCGRHQSEGVWTSLQGEGVWASSE